MLNFSHVSTPAPSSSAASKPYRDIAARIGWTLLILATLYVCYFRNLDAIGFVGPDEPRYAWVARAMAESGDWVTPRLYGEPWFEKPPLLYWGAALCFKLFGVSEAAARLPSAISALLATLALAWLAWRIHGAETARWVLLFLPTTVGMIGFSHASATDMPFTAMLTMAMVAAAVLLGLVPPHEPSSILFSAFVFVRSSTLFTSLLFGLFLGLAVLAKGPAALILCGGAVFCWALFTKRWRDALRLLHPAGIAAFCVTALPWYILCAHRNPDFLRIFILEHNFKRFLTPEFQHIQPWWYYGPILLIGLSPWFVWVFRSSWNGNSAENNPRRNSVLLFAWAIFPVVFFSISKSKLPGYILPAIPPMALLLADGAPGALLPVRSKVCWPVVIFGLLAISAGIWTLHAGYVIPKHSPHYWIVIVGLQRAFYVSIASIVVGIVIITLAALKRAGHALVLALISLLTIMLCSDGVLKNLDELVSMRRAALHVAEFNTSEVFAFQLKRGYGYQLNFYLNRQVPEWTAARSASAIVLTPRMHVEELKAYANVVAVIEPCNGVCILWVEPLAASRDREPQ
jgi:4-amino-4-deoxy-L-arabinose transferase-like glycosyltransferase